MAKANTDRVLRDLYHLRGIGTYKTGVHRPTLSPEDMETRRWLRTQLTSLGHDSQIDGIANVFGRAPGAGPHLLAGSHIESQNRAGWLDGALGVIYALEAARAIAEDSDFAGRGVDVIAFADEEGHFNGGFPGSQSFVGELSEEDIDGLNDRSGRGSLRALLAENDLEGLPRVSMEPGRYSAFLEAHIEQGDRLETAGLKVGIVTSIVAIWQYRIVVDGAQNHAGTTTMASRRDAGRWLLEIWRRLEDRFPALAGPHSVWTAGRIGFEPGAPSIIPGHAEMMFQFRDADQAVLDRLHASLAATVDEVAEAGPCTARLEIVSRTTPALMDDLVRGALGEAADVIAPDASFVMPSGAGHDAQVIAPHIPSGMLFVPSIGGISHHWSENTEDEDIALGAEVYVDAAARLLRN